MKTKPAPAIVAWLIALTLLIFPVMSDAAEEIGFLETFALAEDREEALKQLIPGTEDFYYFNALHAQNQGKHDEVKNLMEPWIKRYGETSRVWEIRNREALLKYKDDPKKSLDFIRSRLGLNFNHNQRQLNQKPNYPTALDPKQVTWEAFQQLAFSRSSTLSEVSESGIDLILRSDIKLDEKRVRDLLARLKYPDYDRLVGLIAADLRTKESRGFGEFQIHNQLLPKQLDALLELRPELKDNSNFINANIRKLHPNEDVDWRQDDEIRGAYLNSVWEYVEPLAPAFNSLKAHSLYQLLQHQQRQGVYSRPLFLKYLQLPRPVSYIEPRYLDDAQRRQNQVNMNADFRAVTMLPPIGGDEPLVRDFFQHFFVEDETWEGYANLVRDTFLKPLFAETKLVSGIGDPAQWFSMLSPAAVQALKDRVDLEFAIANETEFSIDEAVKLDVFVKNVDDLVVKVYEINALNYYLDQKRELNTDLQLDGLIANEETAYDYDADPISRVKRSFIFDGLKGKRGSWVVEFIGNGISSRALIQKGRLQYLARTSGAGTLVTVLDHNNEPVKNPGLWFGDRKYTPTKGVIALPFSNQPGNQQVVLTDGDFATLENLVIPAENYTLNAGFYVARETLIPGNEAELAVRPSLQVNGFPVPASLLEEVKLTIRSVDLDGIESVEEVPGFELKDDSEALHKFRVPNRLINLEFYLEGKISAVSRGGSKELLSASDSIQINTIDQRELVSDLYLSRIDGRYILEVLGKTGEAVVDRAVNVSVKHEDFNPAKNFSLKTDENGQMDLGVLPGVFSIQAQGNWLENRTWVLSEDRHTLPSSVHGIVGEPIEIPGTLTEAQLERSDFAIFESRSGTLVSDDFAKATFANGLITIKGLARGNYEAVLRNPERVITVRVTDSKKSTAGYALSKYRHLEVKNASPLQLADVSTKGDNVVIKIVNGSPSTRLHLVATRFLPEYSVFEKMDVAQVPEPFVIGRGAAETRYISGRDIGEEYRYILERRASQKFPGNMLTRPGLILNPWTLRETETTIVDAKAGEAYKKSAAQKPSSRAGAPGAGRDKASEGRQNEAKSNYDFLASAAPVVFNLVADKNGVFTLNRSDLGDRQHLHIVVVDAENVASRQISLNAGKGTFFRDLRLKQSLELEKHFSQRRKVTQLGTGDSLEIPDLRSSEFEVYDTLASVYGAMMGVNGDATFGEFGFVLQWPDLADERKRELYSKYSSHELNFFLSRHDRPFFEKVIQPYLKNKMDKTFMDHYLIGSDLAQYIEPWKFNRLNIPERILLARRLGGDEPKLTARHIQEIFELQPINAEQNQFWFRSALRGRGMSGGFGGGGAGGYAGVMEQAEMAVMDRAEGRPAGVRMDSLSLEKGKGASFANGRATLGAPAAPISAVAERAAGVDSFADDAEGLIANAPGKKMDAKNRGEMKRELQQLREGEEADEYGLAKDQLKAVRKQLSERQLFRKLESTKEWAENNYYHLPIEQQLAGLISTNGFWRDYAKWDGKGQFYSREFPSATRNFAEMMLALAVLDVPFKAGEHDIKVDDNSLTFTAKSPLIVFHEEIEETPVAEDKPPLLVSENFFRSDDRFIVKANEQMDKFVTEEFLTGVLYGSQVVITNPTSSSQKLDILLQVPQGALPVQGSDYTKTQHVQLAPFSTQKVETYFYFPSDSGEGAFSHYPVHLAKNEETIAWGDEFAFKVVNQLSKVDEASWDYLSQFGTDREVFDYLSENNVQNLDLGLIAWRCRKDVDFFRRVTTLLDQRHSYDATLWSYGIFHNDTGVARQFLLHRDDFLRQCGLWIETELVSIAPVERHWYQHLEYAPLVNARTHKLGQDRKILNQRFRQQYQSQMRVLTYKPEFSQEDTLAVAKYLMLQDRVEDGLAWLDKVKPQAVDEKLQLDYLKAYASFYREEPQVAAKIAANYKDYPVDRWQQRFAQVAAQVKEITGAGDANLTDNEDRDQQQDKLASNEPGFEVASEGQTVTVTTQNLNEVVVNYYEMDLEFLFSSKPFVSGDSGQFSFIRPNESVVKKLAKGKSALEFEVPDNYASKNVLVEVVAAGDRKSTAVFANALSVNLTENYGRVQVRNEKSGKPMSKVYVKVYSRFEDGTVKFFKDGYTDLRGKFDYVSLNTDELNRVEKFSLLIMSEEDGALVREAKPPQR